jgi:hypothetical protein
MQVGPVDGEVRGAIAAHDRVAQFELRQLAAVRAVTHAQPRRREGKGPQLTGEQLPLPQDARGIRPELDAGPDLGERRRLLEHARLPAGAPGRDRGRQARDAAARDQQFARHAASSCRNTNGRIPPCR